MNRINLKYKCLLLIICTFSSLISSDFNFDDIVNIKITKDRNSYRLGEYLKITLDIDVEENFHIYSTDSLKAPAGGETYIEYYDSLIIKKIGNLDEPIPVTKFDKNFNQETSFHKGKFSFIQSIILDENYVSNSDNNYHEQYVCVYYINICRAQ